MTSSAPRYHPQLIRAIRRLDDESLPIAEVWRRGGARADRLGVPRPGYDHVRRIILAERARKAELREIRNEVVGTLATGRVPDPVEALDRLSGVQGRARLRPGRSRCLPLATVVPGRRRGESSAGHGRRNRHACRGSDRCDGQSQVVLRRELRRRLRGRRRHEGRGRPVTRGAGPKAGWWDSAPGGIGPSGWSRVLPQAVRPRS